MIRYVFQKPGKYNVTLPPGYYRFEAWGAQGGKGCVNGTHKAEGGRGAYVSGYISFKTPTTFFCFVGGTGGDGSKEKSTRAYGGYNGGGRGGADTNDDEGSGGGGGASDIRTIDNDLNNETSLKSRIIVAAGGSGSAYWAVGAPGGDLTGYLKINNAANSIIRSNTTNQTNGYELGIGQDGQEHGYTPSSGAGGGYYGGIATDGVEKPVYKAVSSSGSSYVSGFDGCTPHEKYVLRHITMRNGIQEFFSPNGTETIGNVGDGAIVITKIYSYSYEYSFHLKIIHLSLICLIGKYRK